MNGYGDTTCEPGDGSRLPAALSMLIRSLFAADQPTPSGFNETVTACETPAAGSRCAACVRAEAIL